MSKVESAEDAISTSRKRLEHLIASFPHRLRLLERQLPKKIEKAGSKQEQLKILYKTADELFAGVLPKTPCRRGCSGCCHIPVHISLDEARLIHDKTGATMTAPSPPKNFHGVACPFLKNEECSIYDHRPFACRRHVALHATPFWCAPERCNDIKVSQVRFSELEDAFKRLLGFTPIVDIRQVFAPSSPPQTPSPTI
jgi:Fe-S-cluster containining protein